MANMFMMLGSMKKHQGAAPSDSPSVEGAVKVGALHPDDDIVSQEHTDVNMVLYRGQEQFSIDNNTILGYNITKTKISR